MDKIQAEQLARRIKREAPHLIVTVDTVEAVGWKAWAVYINAPGLNEPLPIENPSSWDMHKPYFELHPPSNNS